MHRRTLVFYAVVLLAAQASFAYASSPGSSETAAVRSAVRRAGVPTASTGAPDSVTAVPTANASKEPDPEIRSVGSLAGRGIVQAETVGPWGSGQRLFQAYHYRGSDFDLVAVDPDRSSDDVFKSPVRGEHGAQAMTVGPDGRLYLGTHPGGRVLRFSPKDRTFVDLGVAAAGESHLYDFTVGNDGLIYGGTYPSSNLIRIDPATGNVTTLGRIHKYERYAREIAASGDGFIYIGVGPTKGRLVAHHIATGTTRLLKNQGTPTRGFPRLTEDGAGRVFARMGGQSYRIDRWEAIPVNQWDAPQEPTVGQLADGRRVAVEGSHVRTFSSTGSLLRQRRLTYAGRAPAVHRLGVGPDDRLYASSVLPFRLYREEGGAMTSLGRLGGGQAYSLLAVGDRLAIGAYAAGAPLYRFDPAQAFDARTNPAPVEFNGQDRGWRPKALVEGPLGNLYVAGHPGYGELAGHLYKWNPRTDSVTVFESPVPDQSVVALVTTGHLVIGGTSVRGGSGSHPTADTARVLVWDAVRDEKVADVAVDGVERIHGLVTARDGMIWGLADDDVAFAFNPVTLEITRRVTVPSRYPLYNSIHALPDGSAVAVTRQGVLRIAPDFTPSALYVAPEPVTAGSAIHEGWLYFASGPDISALKLPG